MDYASRATVPAGDGARERPGLAQHAVPLEVVKRRFAVVIPALNEVENVPELLAELRATWERHGLEGDVVLVDDGSTDGTAERTESVGGEWSRLTVVRHRRNFGKTEALMTGARATDCLLYTSPSPRD